MSVSSSSWGLGRAAVCDCGTPWTFLLPFLHDITEAIHLLCDSDDIEVYFKLYLLLYADDTVILAETQEQLQAALSSIFYIVRLGNWKLIQLKQK